MQFQQTTLDNGLTIVAEVNPAAASMALGFFCRTGSRDETPTVAGVSHYLEHMLFKGTPRRSALDVNREFDEMGASYNAFTSEENTVYYAAVLPEFQLRAVDLLADILRPSLREADFATEKNVILEEIALYEDLPHFRVHDQLMATFFAGHPLGHGILGTNESVTALTQPAMREYFDRRYSPRNLTVVAVGNLDYDRLVDEITSRCGPWTPRGADREIAPPPATVREVILPDTNVLREHVGLMAPAPSAQSEARFAAALAASVLGDVTGSRLHYALVEPAFVDEASTSYAPMDGAGAFYTFLSADADRAGTAVRIAREQIEQFRSDGPTDDELQAAKNKIASAATLKGEQPMGRLTSVGADWVYRHEYLPLADQIETLFAVTADDVRTMLQQYDITTASTVALGPLAEL